MIRIIFFPKFSGSTGTYVYRRFERSKLLRGAAAPFSRCARARRSPSQRSLIADGCRDGLDTSCCDVRTCSGPSGMRARTSVSHCGWLLSGARWRRDDRVPRLHGWQLGSTSARRPCTNTRIASVCVI